MTPKNWQGRVADSLPNEYNDQQRSQSSLGPTHHPFLTALFPLREGKSVVLTMENPKLAARKNYRGSKGRIIVVLTPGSALGAKYGLSNREILVSILGSGSCMVRVGQKSANLILAGMPAKLANGLMDALHQIFQEF